MLRNVSVEPTPGVAVIGDDITSPNAPIPFAFGINSLNLSRFFNSYYSPTYGNNPICLARLIATANCL